MRAGASIRITPASAGWTYVGFDVYRLKAGQTVAAGDERPRSLHRDAVRQGRVSAGGKDFGVIGGRASPFEPDPWSVYVPAQSDWSLDARETDCEIAVCTAPGRRQAAGARDPPDQSARKRAARAPTRAMSQHPARDASRPKACWWSR